MPKLVTLIEKSLIFVYFLLLPSQTSYHFWLSESLLFGRKIDYLSPTLYFTHLISLALLFIWIFIRRTNYKLPPFRISYINLILASLLILNIVFAQVPAITLYRFLTLSLTTVFFLFLARHHHFATPLIIFPLSLSLIWTNVLAWTQWLNQSSVGFIFSFLGERPLPLSMVSTAKVSLGNAGLFLRPYATFPHPNALAGYILVVSLFLIFVLNNLRHHKLIFLIKFSLLFSFFTIPLTFSRTSSLGLLSLPLMFFVSHYSKISISKKVLLVVSSLLIVLPVLIPGNPNSLTERLTQYSLAVGIFTSNLFIGVGLGNYLYYSPASFVQIAHNIWLLLLAEMGLPFVILFVFQLTKILKRIFLNYSDSIILIWPIFLTSLTDTYWLTLHQNYSLLFFILIYLVYLPKNAHSFKTD